MKLMAYIGIGSNLDDPVRQVKEALEELDTIPDSVLISQSSLYASKPMGPADQPSVLIQSGLYSALTCRTEIVVGKIIFTGIYDLDRAFQRLGQQYRIRHMRCLPPQAESPACRQDIHFHLFDGKAGQLGRNHLECGGTLGGRPDPALLLFHGCGAVDGLHLGMGDVIDLIGLLKCSCRFS